MYLVRFPAPVLAGLALVAGLAGCGEAPAGVCEDMCCAASALYGDCLEDWGLGWESAGYENERDFQASCHTWAWEQRILEDHAGEEGQVDKTCAERADLFATGNCEDFSGIDWSASPW